MAGDAALRRCDERRDRSLHVGDPAPIQIPVALGWHERIAGPAIDRSRRDDVHVPGKTEQRRAVTVARPEIAHPAAIDAFAYETGGLKPARNNVDAPTIVRGERPAGDQLPGEG